MCVYVFMWVHILVYTYTYEEQRLMLRVLIVSNPRVWKTASHWHSLVSQSVPGILPSFLPRTGFTDAHPIVTFTGDPGKQIQVLRLAHQAFYQPSHCPSPTRVWGADAWTVKSWEPGKLRLQMRRWVVFELENLGQTEERMADGGHGLDNSLSKVAASYGWDFPFKPLLALIKGHVGIKPFLTYSLLCFVLLQLGPRDFPC